MEVEEMKPVRVRREAEAAAEARRRGDEGEYERAGGGEAPRAEAGR